MIGDAPAGPAAANNAARATAIRFMLSPRRLSHANNPRPVAKSGKLAGAGTASLSLEGRYWLPRLRGKQPKPVRKKIQKRFASGTSGSP